MLRCLELEGYISVLLSCSITSGALGSPGLLPSLLYYNNIVAQHHHTNNNPQIFPTKIQYSDYFLPLEFLADAVEFFAVEMVSDTMGDEMREMATKFPWIDDDNASTYFEMALGDIPS